MSAIVQPRQPRREARLGCWLEWEGHRRLAFTSDLSQTGLSLQLPTAQAFPDLRPGDRMVFQLSLAAEEGVEGTARVVWVDPEDRDVRDGKVFGFGLELEVFEGNGRTRLASFLEDFRYSVVVLDDDPDCLEQYEELGEVYRLFTCQEPEEAMAVLERQDVAVLIVGQALPGMDALTFLRNLSDRLPNTRASRVLVSEYTIAGQLQLMVNLGRLYSFLRKPFGGRELHQLVRRAVDAYVLGTENTVLLAALRRANERLEKENAYLRQRFVGAAGFESLVGNSPALRAALLELSRVQRTDATVHLHGETGTGKELFARALHEGGPRRSGPFVVQACAGISDGLLQSTLFGHRRGAFTGADKDQPGVFQRADGGTLLLDEVSELSPAAQAGLLRTLQEGEVLPVGASRAVPVDVRILSASNKDLRQEVRAGNFREDLYFRLVVLPIRVPTLRERKGDIALLAAHFLDLYCERRGKDLRGFTLEAVHALERYRWPGNVRELENEIQRLIVLAEDGGKVHLEHLSTHLRPRDPGSVPAPARAAASPGEGIPVPRHLSFDEAVEHLQQTLVRRALESAGQNVTHAATALGVERSRLAKMKKRLGI